MKRSGVWGLCQFLIHFTSMGELGDAQVSSQDGDSSNGFHSVLVVLLALLASPTGDVCTRSNIIRSDARITPLHDTCSGSDLDNLTQKTRRATIGRNSHIRAYPSSIQHKSFASCRFVADSSQMTLTGLSWRL